jgi:TonB-dependent SusC/RagA subfamily outer membrane receptor
MKAIVQRFVLLIFFVTPFLSFSQTRSISGQVLAFNKYPVNNITVKAKKAKTETITNEEGYFEIDVKKNDVIRIKESVFLDYDQKISEDMESLKINLIFDNTRRNIDKAVEAGFIARDDLEFGLENLYHDNSVYAYFVDVYDAIKYALPETTIIIEDGSKAVQFRGPKTIHGSNAALTLVDGVIVDDISFLMPVNIVSISKLSSSAASLYGARGANGVILIQTR